MKKIFLILILLILVVHPSWGGDAAPPDLSWEIKDWNGMVFYRTHGKVVWGHDFGFFKTPEHCDEDVFYLVFSTYEEGLDQYKDDKINLKLSVDQQTFEITAPFFYTSEYGPMEFITITNMVFSDDLMRAIEKGENLTIEIVGPTDLVPYFDIPKEEYDLSELIYAQEKALDVCRQKALKIFQDGNPLALLDKEHR